MKCRMRSLQHMSISSYFLSRCVNSPEMLLISALHCEYWQNRSFLHIRWHNPRTIKSRIGATRPRSPLLCGFYSLLANSCMKASKLVFASSTSYDNNTSPRRFIWLCFSWLTMNSLCSFWGISSADVNTSSSEDGWDSLAGDIFWDGQSNNDLSFARRALHCNLHIVSLRFASFRFASLLDLLIGTKAPVYIFIKFGKKWRYDSNWMPFANSACGFGWETKVRL
jgi:hypothetical protein